MSAENDGNLDNDTAQDLLYEISATLTNSIISLLRDPMAHDPEEEPIGHLFVYVEMCFALHDKDLLSVVPEPALVKQLVADFMARWEAAHRELYGSVRQARKKSMKRTFDRLYAICNEGDALECREIEPGAKLSEDQEAILRVLTYKKESGEDESRS